MSAAPPIDEDDLHTHLRFEYLHLQSAVDRFDARALTIKAWSVTLTLALLSATRWGQFADAAVTLAIAAAAIFWFLEAQWKVFQRAHYARINTIQAYFRGETAEIAPLQIGASWEASFAQLGFKGVLKQLFRPWVMLPHAVLLAAAVALAVRIAM